MATSSIRRFRGAALLSAAAALITLPVGMPAWAAGAFHRDLALQGIRFEVHSSGEGSQQQLAITASGARAPIKPIRQTVNGRVVGAEVADLDSNGLPEIYVYVQGAGSGSYGELVAYAVGSSSNLSPIYLQELTGPTAQGYRGHDQFRVVEGCLVRLFPIYQSSDSHAKASGGERQICYKLKAGEASWILRPTSVLKF